MAVFAELRVDTIRENMQRGMDHARARGKAIGRPSKLSSEQREALRPMRDEDGASFARIAAVLRADKSTVSRACADAGGAEHGSPPAG